MTKNEICDWLFKSEDGYDYSDHRLLVNLTCVFEDDNEETEVTFAVPFVFVLQCIHKFSEWQWEDLKKWLENEYTSEDSQEILEQAILQNQIAFWKIN